MRTSLKANIACTTASLAAAIALTAGLNLGAWLWLVWGLWLLLAAGTVALVVNDRRNA
ncbi:hypothetical protein [Streptomyces sp. NPDC085596]|uniref:hypothetical protein n=1 Tax=Streptomyces sp. NPDC085596 TaxID=3365731 RepID=UPI0037D8F01B